MNFELLTPQRLLFLASLTVLTMSGGLVIVMDTWSKGGAQYYQHTLNKGLWKFESDESKSCDRNIKVWAWRKLLVAGIMIAAVFLTVLSKVVSVKFLLTGASMFLLLWLVFLLLLYY